jgi:hypothetical protein
MKKFLKSKDICVINYRVLNLIKDLRNGKFGIPYIEVGFLKFKLKLN